MSKLNFLISILEVDSGMDQRDFRDLMRKTSSASVATFDFVEDVTFISSVLDEVVGKTLPTEFTPVPFRDAASSCLSEIGKKVGLQAKKVSASSKDSTLFFETLLTGVFGVP
jgi:hypothetical protein